MIKEGNSQDKLIKEGLVDIYNSTELLWDEIREKKLFLSGATGFFGIWLIKSFIYANDKLNLNSQASILTRNPNIFEKQFPSISSNPSIKLYKGDIRDFKFLDEAESSVLSCDAKSDERFTLLTHQKLVKYYLNIFTPYRGLLLYHGLGAGKTCASIAVAEGMKTHRKILIMTPASLRMNYIEELKKCGDPLYKRDQYWEFLSTVSNSEYMPLLKSEIGNST